VYTDSIGNKVNIIVEEVAVMEGTVALARDTVDQVGKILMGNTLVAYLAALVEAYLAALAALVVLA